MLTAILLICACTFRAAGASAPHVRNFGQVSPSIYRGAEPSEPALEDLVALRVKLVVDLREPGPGTFREKAETEHLGMLYRNVPMRPWGAPTASQVHTVLTLLARSDDSPVYVHCRRGKDRTGTVVACYRMEHDGWSNDRALAEAKSYGMSSAERGMRMFILHFSTLMPATIAPSSAAQDSTRP